MSNRPTLEEIKQHAINLLGNNIFNKYGDRDIIRRRQVSHYVAHKIYNYAQTSVGFCLGSKDHSTVRHSCLIIEYEMNVYKYIKDYVDGLIKLCETVD